MDGNKKVASDGSTASYSKLPAGATELQHLISHRNMNAQIGEIFRACYRYGLVSHSDMLRDAKKLKFYAEAEIERLEMLEKQFKNPREPEDVPAKSAKSWKLAEARMDVVAQNGNTGEHYAEQEQEPFWKPVDLTACEESCKGCAICVSPSKFK